MQIIDVEVCENKPLNDCAAGGNLTFKVDNYIDENGVDLLKAYEKQVKKSEYFFV